MKFRISISQEQMQFILTCPDCPEDLKKQIQLALFKAGHGLTKPAYEIAPKTASASSPKPASLEKKYAQAVSYLERGQPIPEELKASYDEFRYLNDLMAEDEIAAYELAEGF